MKDNIYRQLLVEKLEVMKEVGEVWISYHGARMRLVPPGNLEFVPCDNLCMFVVKDRGRFRFVEAVRRKGDGPFRDVGSGWVFQDRAVVAMVAEYHDGTPPAFPPPRRHHAT